MNLQTTTNQGTATNTPTSVPPVTPSNPSPTPTTPVAPTTYKPTTNTVATFGEKSQSVIDLQNKLNGMGAGLKTDGMYGPLTKAAYDKYIGSVNTPKEGEKTPVDPSKAPTDPSKAPTTPAPTPKSQDEIDADELSKKRIADAQVTYDQILGIQNGTVPLSAGDQAQIDGLKQQFQQMIEQQNLTNAGAVGLANVRGFQTGAAEYDANFAVKTIGSIVTAGANKITDLNIKMASAVASLTQALKDNKIEGIKSAYNLLETARKDRQATIEKTIEATQKIIKEQQAKKEAMTKDINAIAEEVGKNGGDAKLRALVSASPDVASAIQNAGDYLQTGTGVLGDYIQYKRATTAKGLVPLDYMAFKDNEEKKESQRKASEAYSSSYNSALGKAAGDAKGAEKYGGNGLKLTPSQINSTVNTIAGAFDNEPIVKEYNTIKRNVATFKELGSSATDDIQRIYIFAKVADPNSAVKETEYASIEKYAQALLQRTGLKVSRIFTPTGVLTEQARSAMDKTLGSSMKTSESMYNNLSKEYQRQIDDAYAGKSRVITNYSPTVEPSQSVDEYIKSNPTKAETVAKLYELPGWDDAKVWEYIQQTQ